jgi:hypothetical protein
VTKTRRKFHTNRSWRRCVSTVKNCMLAAGRGDDCLSFGPFPWRSRSVSQAPAPRGAEYP